MTNDVRVTAVNRVKDTRRLPIYLLYQEEKEKNIVRNAENDTLRHRIKELDYEIELLREELRVAKLPISKSKIQPADRKEALSDLKELKFPAAEYGSFQFVKFMSVHLKTVRQALDEGGE